MHQKRRTHIRHYRRVVYAIPGIPVATVVPVSLNVRTIFVLIFNTSDYYIWVRNGEYDKGSGAFFTKIFLTDAGSKIHQSTTRGTWYLAPIWQGTDCPVPLESIFCCVLYKLFAALLVLFVGPVHIHCAPDNKCRSNVNSKQKRSSYLWTEWYLPINKGHFFVRVSINSSFSSGEPRSLGK